ncbi:hypothetical protein J0X15_09220 [Roseibium sp. CAU 1637]|uniref:Uncharacterized protein n=1 Tax=Roseibium limicola TaxID=2816037 RepID=A0A939J9H4_9HYPH|nr:hypothetical protein [Roseibium limicola]MBO0345398.1 hypothetical protein [Roseibium limicola]
MTVPFIPGPEDNRASPVGTRFEAQLRAASDVSDDGRAPKRRRESLLLFSGVGLLILSACMVVIAGID